MKERSNEYNSEREIHFFGMLDVKTFRKHNLQRWNMIPTEDRKRYGTYSGNTKKQ